MGVFDMVESYLVKSRKFAPTTMLRAVVRTVYVGMSLFIYFWLKLYINMYNFYF